MYLPYLQQYSAAQRGLPKVPKTQRPQVATASFLFLRSIPVMLVKLEDKKSSTRSTLFVYSLKIRPLVCEKYPQVHQHWHVPQDTSTDPFQREEQEKVLAIRHQIGASVPRKTQKPPPAEFQKSSVKPEESGPGNSASTWLSAVHVQQCQASRTLSLQTAVPTALNSSNLNKVVKG